MRSRAIGVFFIVLMMLAVWALPAGAIAGGEKSDDARVGALFAIVDIPGVGEVSAMFCSGSQASDRVFLTAGHCLAWSPYPPAAGFPPGTIFVGWAVSFDDEAYDPLFFGAPAPGATLIYATGAAWDPGFGHDAANLRDYGVVLFEEGALPGPYVELPYQGQLDDMKRSHELKGLVFDRVGYGVHPEFKQGPPRIWDDGFRYEAKTPYKALNQNWLRLNENHDATGLGGGCYGDSGSPILSGNVAFAVTTGGDPICRSNAYNQRLDTAEAQAFLGTYLP